MNLRQPWMLLLAGILSASGSGCAIYEAASTNPGRHTGATGSAERYVSIARAFENQCRYDQAEAMYRKALRMKPGDEAIQNQLQQLADRRDGRDFAPDSVSRAIAMADQVSGRRDTSSDLTSDEFEASNLKTELESSPSSNSPDLVEQAASVDLFSADSPAPNDVGKVALQPLPDHDLANFDAQSQSTSPMLEPIDAVSLGGSAEVFTETPFDELETQPSADERTGESKTADEQLREFATELQDVVADINSSTDRSTERLTAPIPPGMDANGDFIAEESVAASIQLNTSDNAAVDAPVSMDELFAATDNLDENVPLIIRSLHAGDTVDTRTLAAALLGDCGTMPAEIAFALATNLRNASDQGLQLAIADSQIQRGISDEATIETLLTIANDHDSVFQVQAVSSLRYFATSALSRECQSCLNTLVQNGSPKVRAAALLSLGDYEETAITLTALQEILAVENDVAVRHAAEAAIARKGGQIDTAGHVTIE